MFSMWMWNFFFFLFLSSYFYGCEFDIFSLHKSNTSWANTYFEYIWVISFLFNCSVLFTISLNLFLCIVCRSRHSTHKYPNAFSSFFEFLIKYHRIQTCFGLCKQPNQIAFEKNCWVQQTTYIQSTRSLT